MTEIKDEKATKMWLEIQSDGLCYSFMAYYLA